MTFAPNGKISTVNDLCPHQAQHYMSYSKCKGDDLCTRTWQVCWWPLHPVGEQVSVQYMMTFAPDGVHFDSKSSIILHETGNTVAVGMWIGPWYSGRSVARGQACCSGFWLVHGLQSCSVSLNGNCQFLCFKCRSSGIFGRHGNMVWLAIKTFNFGGRD